MPKQMSNRQPTPNIGSITYWRKFAVHRVIYTALAALFGLSAVAYFGSPRGATGGGTREERQSAPFVVVNGEPIKRATYESRREMQRERMRQMRMMPQFGNQEVTEIQQAQDDGRILEDLIDRAIETNAAKKHGVKVTDADIDKHIQLSKMTDAKGKQESDDDFEKRLEQNGTTLADYRDELRELLLPDALRDSLANQQKVTEDDLLKTYDKVKARKILIPVVHGQGSLPGALPDAQAKTKAEKILAELKGGADFAKLADQYSGDPANERMDFNPKTKKQEKRKQGGLVSADMGGWYARGEGQSKEFEDATFALQKGQMSDVVKTPEGYVIVKVEDTKRELPKTYAKDKAELLMDEKRKRASKPYQDLIDAEKKSAKIEWKDPGLKWRYDFAKQGMAMSPMGGPDDASKDAFIDELRAYTAKNKEDGPAFLVLGQQLDTKMMMATIRPGGAKPVDRTKLQDEAIAAYEQALKKTEDKQSRRRLASLYEERGRKDDAVKQYEKIMKLMAYDDDPNSRFAYNELESEFRRAGRDDLAQKAHERWQKLNDRWMKEQEAKKAAAAKAGNKAGTPGLPGGPGVPGAVTIPGGTINVAPAEGDKKADTGKKADAGAKKPEAAGKKPETAPASKTPDADKK